MDILLCFTDAVDLSLTEIAGRVGLHKSTVHRLLASLEGKNFIVRDPNTEKYRLGFRIWELSANRSRSDDPAVMLLPEMERLRDELGETISLYVRDGKERIRIQAVQSNREIRRVAPVGVRLPLYAGAASKILLAYEEPQIWEELIASEEWPDETDLGKYREQLLQIRRSGFATSIEEREQGAAAVAAPVLNRSHKLIAALSVSGPSSRFRENRMQQAAPSVMEAARRMGTMV